MKIERFPEKCCKCGQDLFCSEKREVIKVPIFDESGKHIDDKLCLEFAFSGICSNCGAIHCMDTPHIVEREKTDH